MHRMGADMKLPAYCFLMICISWLFSGCSIGSECKDTVVRSSDSPDAKTVVVATVANCGATSDFFTYISIRKSDVPLRGDGMLFGYDGRADLKITWSSSNDMRVACTGQCLESKIYRQVVREAHYTIQYSGFVP